MTLPTTATTAKQSAKKAARTRKINDAKRAEELAAVTIPPEAYSIKAVVLPNLPESEISVELLQHFHELGMTRDEIKAAAGSWLITQAELAQWEAKIGQADTTERQRIDRETAKLAAQMEACILQRGKVQTKAILAASAERLLEFIDYYEEELDDLYPDLTAAEDGTPEKAEHQTTWDRLNKFLWEAKTQAGAGPVTLSVLTNQTLNHLDQAIDAMEEG